MGVEVEPTHFLPDIPLLLVNDLVSRDELNGYHISNGDDNTTSVSHKHFKSIAKCTETHFTSTGVIDLIDPSECSVTIRELPITYFVGNYIRDANKCY